jgi:hypothetical protein
MMSGRRDGDLVSVFEGDVRTANLLRTALDQAGIPAGGEGSDVLVPRYALRSALIAVDAQLDALELED